MGRILFGIPQGSFLGYLLNIFMGELFTILQEIDCTNDADDNTTLVSESILENVVSSIESCFASLFDWFSNNGIKTPPEKCNLSMNVNRPATIKISKQIISNSYLNNYLVLKSIVN